MTRKDIKKGTGYVMLFSVACTVIIFSLAFVKQLRADRKEAREKTATPTYWSDRLTNKHSEHAPAAKMDAIIQNFINRWDIKGLSLAVTQRLTALRKRLRMGRPREGSQNGTTQYHAACFGIKTGDGCSYYEAG